MDVKKLRNTITIKLEDRYRIMHHMAWHEYDRNSLYEVKWVEDYPIRNSKVALLVKHRHWIGRTQGRSVGNE